MPGHTQTTPSYLTQSIQTAFWPFYNTVRAAYSAFYNLRRRGVARPSEHKTFGQHCINVIKMFCVYRDVIEWLILSVILIMYDQGLTVWPYLLTQGLNIN